jgi:beta-carotene hydroxylase
MSNHPATTDLSFAQATQIARSHERAIAWPTVALVITLFCAYWLIAWSAATNFLPVWLAVLLNAFVAYAAYTPAHEATHGNVQQVVGRSQTQGTWLNNAVGILASAPLLHNFSMHQVSHLAHHANTNDPDKDPDHWMAVRGFGRVLFRASTLVFVHYVQAWGICSNRSDGARRKFWGVLQNTLWIAAVAALAISTNAWIVLVCTVLSSLIGAAALAVSFDWLPHTPHTDRGRFTNTYAVQFPRPVHGIFTLVMLYQNYHHIHHLWPRVPFFSYARVHNALSNYLQAQGLPTRHIGR